MWTLWKVKHSWSTYSTDFSKLGPPCALCTGTEFWRLNFPKKSPSRMNNVIAMETLERHQEAIKATNMEGKIIKTKRQLLFSLCFKKAWFNVSMHKKYPAVKFMLLGLSWTWKAWNHKCVSVRNCVTLVDSRWNTRTKTKCNTGTPILRNGMIWRYETQI